MMGMFSWETPIEEELLRWATHMKRSNLSYITTTIWGKKQKQEAQIYANAFEMMEKRIKREMRLRAPTTTEGND